ncbi:uncharacterized protein LOC101852651 [Aplysia californica]|uniref:Uncharacterized protein LOC101852651 n=1 Tax=Aplysia californica TaxID=6500 RepID=A0ABM1A9W1_APLCA|nr:uncharacterized protein LOC101852651 [Aplysia californica]
MSLVGAVIVVLLLMQGLVIPSQCDLDCYESHYWRRKHSFEQVMKEPIEEGRIVNRTCDLNRQSCIRWFAWHSHRQFILQCYIKEINNSSCGVVNSTFSSFSIRSDEKTGSSTLSFTANRQLKAVQCDYETKFGILTYSRPENLTCSSPEYTNNSNTVSVTCVTSDLFPTDPRCVLYRQTDGGSRVQTSLPPIYGSDTTGSVSGPSCTFTIQASELGAGTHRLSVNMYPQFDGSGVAYGKISTVSPDVTFYDSERNGYIMVTIELAIVTPLATFLLGILTSLALYCFVVKTEFFHKKWKPPKSRKPQENSEKTRAPLKYPVNIEKPPHNTVTGNRKKISATAGQQKEKQHVNMGSDFVMTLQDMTPQAEVGERHYSNVSVTSSASKAKKKGQSPRQGQNSKVGFYDVIPAQTRHLSASNVYQDVEPESNYSNVGCADGQSASAPDDGDTEEIYTNGSVCGGQ